MLRESCRNLKKLWAFLEPRFEEWGMFIANGTDEHVKQQQCGAFRTNCIDCLDRTNVVQANFARKAVEAALRYDRLMSPQQGDLQSEFPGVRSSCFFLPVHAYCSVSHSNQ